MKGGVWVREARVGGVRDCEQIELGVQPMLQVELDLDLACPKLSGEPAQSRLVLGCGHTDGQLLAKLLGHLLFEASGCGIVNKSGPIADTHTGPKLVLGRVGHADEE